MLQDGRTALFWAAYSDHVEVVKLLVKHEEAVDIGRNEVISYNYYQVIQQVR